MPKWRNSSGRLVRLRQAGVELGKKGAAECQAKEDLIRHRAEDAPAQSSGSLAIRLIFLCKALAPRAEGYASLSEPPLPAG